MTIASHGLAVEVECSMREPSEALTSINCFRGVGQKADRIPRTSISRYIHCAMLDYNEYG